MLKNLKSVFAVAALLAASFLSSSAQAGVFITEFSSNSGGSGLFEFVEFTNTGAAPVDMTGWSEDDNNRTPNKGQHSLSAFGTLAPGESAIFTQAQPNDFRVYWWGSVAAAPAGLKIIGPYSNDNLSSSGDEVNLYDNSFLPGGAPVVGFTDRLTYGGPNGGLASGVSRNGPLSELGLNNNLGWADSALGDFYGSFAAAAPANNGTNYSSGAVEVSPSMFGNPGTYVPEPSAMVLGMIGAGLLCVVARRTRRVTN